MTNSQPKRTGNNIQFTNMLDDKIVDKKYQMS